MPLQPFPLSIPPGVVTDATKYTLKGRYTASNRIRFVLGKAQTIGGWERTVAGETLNGVCRTIYSFGDLSGNRNLFFGTNTLAYVWNNAANLYDITPVYSTTVFANPISTTITSVRVGVTINPGDPKVLGSFFSITGSAAVGGIPAINIDGIHQIVEVIGNTIYFDQATAATSTVAAGGGAAVTVALYWPAGYADTIAAGGWGSGGWGSGGWGGGSMTNIVPLRFWSADSWGEDLLISPSDGPIFYWDKTAPSTRAVAISGMVGASQVPVAARQIMVSDQNRTVLAFAVNPIGSSTQDPMLVRWSDNENYLEWSPAVAGSAAGELRLTVGSVFVGAIEAPNEVLAWTDAGLHAMQVSADVWSMRVVSPNIQIFGPRAMGVAGDAVYWMGSLGFYRYAGSVQHIACPIERFILNLVDASRRPKTVCAVNSEFNEVWWFFCSVGSTSTEPDMYAKVNYVDNVWDYGFLERTAWHDIGLFSKPVAVLPTGEVVYQEVGLLDATDPLSPVPFSASITTGPIPIDQLGGSFVATRYLIPDVYFDSSDGNSGLIDVTPSYDRGPGTSLVSGPMIAISATGGATWSPNYTPRYRMRGRGASIQFHFESSYPNGWRLGDHSILGMKDGRK